MALEPYLLDLSTYNSLATNGSIGREFRVSEVAYCTGLRIRVDISQTTNIYLWRTDTQAKVAEGLVLSASGTCELLFATPAVLDPALTYRMSASTIDGMSYYNQYKSGNEHPDGDVTILTGNSYVYSASNRVYPAGASTAYSFAGEPMISLSVSTPVTMAAMHYKRLRT